MTHRLPSLRSAATAASALLAFLFLADCVSERSTGPKIAELRISANVQATTIASLVVNVRAADIQPSLVFNLTLDAGVATGTLRVPAGAARTFTVRAFDATGLETHRGEKTLDIVAGSNPAVSILLNPIAGQQPIEATLGTLTVTITQAPVSLAQGGTAQLVATVTGPDGPIAVSPDAIRWATANPATLTVNPETGVATAQAPGEARVVATYAGTAGVATIRVDPVLLAVGDLGRCGSLHLNDEATAAIVDTLEGLVLTLGDHAYERGTHKNFSECYTPSWGRFKARTRPTPGNHDYDTTNAVGYFTYFDEVLRPFGGAALDPGKGYYSYDLGSWHIISLNSELPFYRANGDAEFAAQVEWLRNDLKATSAKCVLAYWHRARYSSATHGNEPKMDPLWDELYAACADVVLVSHDHSYERFAPMDASGASDPARGLRQLVVGTGGYSLYNFLQPKPNSEVRLNQYYGVLAVVLGKDDYNWRFIAAPDGVVRDSGSGACH
jgi:hypothetical protein